MRYGLYYALLPGFACFRDEGNNFSSFSDSSGFSGSKHLSASRVFAYRSIA